MIKIFKNKKNHNSANHDAATLPSHNALPQGHDRMVFSWTAPEYIQMQRTTTWYLVAGIIAALALTWAIFSDNLTMVLAVIVFIAVYEYLHRHHPPKQIKVEISEMGVKVGHMFFPYSHIQAFWVIYQYGLKTLNLRATNHFFSDVIIQLDDQDPVEIRQYLVGQIPEWEGKTERLTDMILRLLKI